MGSDITNSDLDAQVCFSDFVPNPVLGIGERDDDELYMRMLRIIKMGNIFG